jgi:ribulose 1,5-bisphosphate synthetase/thiazole synthase
MTSNDERLGTASTITSSSERLSSVGFRVMSIAEYDIVIIGGGHKRLACATCLSSAGLDVAVLERRSDP